MTDWIRFHAELCEGTKQSIPRETRFIFLELARHARKHRGMLVCRAAPTLVASLQDLLGGDRAQVKRAVPVLLEEQMISAEQTKGGWTVLIPSWARWNASDSSTERVARHRETRAGPSGNSFLGDDDDVSLALQDEPRAPTRPPARSHSSSFSSVISSLSVEDFCRNVMAASQAIALGIPLAAAEEIAIGVDIFGDEAPEAVARTVWRIDRAVRAEPTAVRLGLESDVAIREALSSVRTWLGEHPKSTQAARLARVETTVVRYILGDCRKGVRAPLVAAAAPQDSPAERARRAKASAEAKAREEAVAAEKKREAEDFARRRAEGKLPMPTFMTPATPEGGGK